MRHTSLAILTAVGIVSVATSHANAQSVANALQIGLGTDFVSYSAYTQRVTAPPPPPPAAPVGTMDYKNDIHQTRWGVSDHSNVNLEIGYGLNDSMVLGGMLVLGGWSQYLHSEQASSTVHRQDSSFNLFIGPKFDFMFLPDSRVRPFVGAAIGLSRVAATTTTTNATAVTTTQSDNGYTGLGLLLRGGVRCFLTPGFSLDPAFVFGFATMSGSALGAEGVPNQAASYDSGLTGFSVGLGVTASGWVGL
jgi:hypothetical protein